MARIRTIKPSFFTDPAMADLPPATRLTYIGLWTHVDDAGRCVDDARLVKAAVWPLDDRYTAKKVESDLATLAKAGRVERYEVDGKRFLRVVHWRKHQVVNKPQKSGIPPSPVESDSGTATGTPLESDGNPPVALPGGNGIRNEEVEREGNDSSSVSEEPRSSRTPEEEILLAETWRCLALRRLNARGPDQPPVVDVQAWIAKTAGQVAEIHRDSPLLARIRPGTEPEELGRLLEPPTASPPVPSQPQPFEPVEHPEPTEAGREAARQARKSLRRASA